MMYEKISNTEMRILLGSEWPSCQCHNEPMRWKADATRSAGGRWRCAERGRQYMNARHADGRSAKTYANQLLRGERIGLKSNHHHGMRHILGAVAGDELEVSLVDESNPTLYLGRKHLNLYVLATDPNAYVLETRIENLSRGNPTRNFKLMDRLIRADAFADDRCRMLFEKTKKENR